CARYVTCHILLCGLIFVIFFFQAEDGIRDSSVTGVQTCALPILELFVAVWRTRTQRTTPGRRTRSRSRPESGWWSPGRRSATSRSEERRVGKECISRRAT